MRALDVRFRFTSPHPKDYPEDLLRVMADTPNAAGRAEFLGARVEGIDQRVRLLSTDAGECRTLAPLKGLANALDVPPQVAKQIHMPAQSGSDARMIDASVDGSCLKTLAVSQIVSAVEMSPV